MTSTVLLRTIYGVAIAGLLIAGGYLLGFQFLWQQQCTPESHWAMYSGEDVTADNFFGPSSKLLSPPARDLMRASIPSLYKASPENQRQTIRMVEWANFPYAVGVLTISESRDGVFKARFTVIRFEWDTEKDKTVTRIREDRSWPLNPIDSKKLQEHLKADDAWRECRASDLWSDGAADRGAFVIEESRGGRYRMLVTEGDDADVSEALQENAVPGGYRWSWRSYDFYRNLTGGGMAPFV